METILLELWKNGKHEATADISDMSQEDLECFIADQREYFGRDEFKILREVFA